MRNIFFLIRYF